jgi:ligand-binding SRPBCC domain-containing protein
MAVYHHEFIVNAPLQAVRDFHRRSASMGAITPPPVIVRIHDAPELLGEGDEMRFTMWLGPLPIRWHARIEQVSPNGFVDRQLDGPFRRWDHTHRFEAIDEQTTRVIDQIETEYKSDPWSRVLGMGMRLNLPVLFAFRQWKTKRLLQQEPHTSYQPS